MKCSQRRSRKVILLKDRTLMVIVSLVLFGSILFGVPSSGQARPGFDVHKMSDMSDLDPTPPVIPTGDTIKIGAMGIFSGSGASAGEYWWIIYNWVAHDINKKGGILADGKWKKIQLIQGDTQGKPAIAKQVAERLCLEEKVHVLWGPTGSHLAQVIQQVAGKYKVIFVNPAGYSDSLMDGKHFNRYTFRTACTTTVIGQAMGYFLSQRPERKFYILCQDYLAGHDLAEAFKKGLKQYKPHAQIVGEAYHPLWVKDFAPYLTKIHGSGAEVIFTGDWLPDSGNLLKQARDLGMRLPFAHIWMDDPNALCAVGPAGSVGLLQVNECLIDDETAEHRTWLRNWNQQWKRWKRPYNTLFYKWPSGGTIGAVLSQMYWFLDILQRAGSTDPEKIIRTWEGDEYRSITGAIYQMRACDHQVIKEMYATEFVHPNKWFEGCAYTGKIIKIPAKYVTPPVPEDLERCRK